MLEKIISGGRPGAEKAALDASIKLGIGYGGWIPKGGAAAGIMNADRYNLVEMPSTKWEEAFKKNIRESDGTLIFSHGTPFGRSESLVKTTQRYSTPTLHVDLNNTGAFNAASLVNDWIIDNDLSVVHITGSLESEDGKIYPATLDILQAVYFLNLTETSMNPPGTQNPLLQPLVDELPPKTAEAAIDVIINEMHLKDRALMANMKEEELAPLQLTLGLYIKKKLDTWSQDAMLARSCEAAAEKQELDKSNMPMVFIKMIWKRLRDTHRLRVVK